MMNHLPFSLREFDLQLVNDFSAQLAGSRKRKVALVAQGGGQRGIFTAGVFDAFLEAGFDPFELYVGTSAGALNISSYISRQPQFGYNFIVNYTTDDEFFNIYNYLRKQKAMNLDWALDTVAPGGSLQLDIQTAREVLQHRAALACATRKDTLQDIYLPMYRRNWQDVLRASCAIPVLYNQPVNLHNLEWVDGGVSAAVPVREAWLRGADLVVVVRTEPVMTGDETGVFDEWREKVETVLPDYLDKLSLNQSLDKVKAIHSDLTQRFEQWKTIWNYKWPDKAGRYGAEGQYDINDIARTESSKSSSWRILSVDNIERFLSLAGKGKNTEVIEMLSRYYQSYDEANNFLLNPPAGLKVIQIAPERSLKSRALLSGKDDLEVDYREGKLIGRYFVDHLAEVINEATALRTH